MNENEVEWQLTEVSRGSEKMIKSISMRRSRARLDAMLTPALRDASREIDRAYEDRERKNNLGAKGINLLSTGGGGRFMTDELMDAMNKRIDSLIRWEVGCTPFLRHTVEALNQLGYTATTYAALKGITSREVTIWYREGLRVYAKMRGLE